MKPFFPSSVVPGPSAVSFGIGLAFGSLGTRKRGFTRSKWGEVRRPVRQVTSPPKFCTPVPPQYKNRSEDETPERVLTSGHTCLHRSCVRKASLTSELYIPREQGTLKSTPKFCVLGTTLAVRSSPSTRQKSRLPCFLTQGFKNTILFSRSTVGSWWVPFNLCLAENYQIQLSPLYPKTRTLFVCSV